MSTTQIRNLTARCLDRDNPSDIVLHEVKYELQESGAWVDMTTQVMATDPMDAINVVKGRLLANQQVAEDKKFQAWLNTLVGGE